jgi:fermentation-respiration switch protein FrsA (DUF1100 family)
VPRQSLAAAGRVDFSKPHEPLLFIAGGSDHIIPASLNRSNYRRYRARHSITDFREFDGRDHLTIVEPGWEEVADFVLAWLDQVAPAEDTSTPAPEARVSTRPPSPTGGGRLANHGA